MVFLSLVVIKGKKARLLAILLVASSRIRPLPSVILDEPTLRGIDAAARRCIRQAPQEPARQGASILLISSDMEEIIELTTARSPCIRDLLIMSSKEEITQDKPRRPLHLDCRRRMGLVKRLLKARGLEQPSHS